MYVSTVALVCATVKIILDGFDEISLVRIQNDFIMCKF